MLIQITDAGVALMQGAEEPLVMTSYQLGGAFGYTPSPTQTDIQGPLEYVGVPSAPVIAGVNTLLYPIYVPENVGTFDFGEIGLFYGATLFAIIVLDSPMTKAPLDVNTNTGGPIVIDFFVPITSSNYQMWANTTQANTMKASTVTGPEGLPPSPNAVPNLFVVEPAGVGQTFMAFSDRFGVWTFTGFGQVATLQVVSATANTVTVTAASVASIVFQGLGTLLSQFTTGAAYSTARYIDGMTPSGGNVTLSFNAPLTIIPNPGDTLRLYEPQTTQTPSGSATSGTFTTLVSTGATSLGPTQAVSINNTPIGATTPSSGRFTTLTATANTTLANLTATAIENTPIGQTTPAAGKFTDLVVTTSFSGPGLATLFASPGPIGSTTPNSGSFTSLTASGTTTLGAVVAASINGASIGASVPGTGKFTSLTVTGATTLNGIVNSGNSVLQAVTATTVTATGAGQFASLNVTGSSTFASINSTPIGATTASTGAFTTLTASGTTTLGVLNAGAVTATSLNATPIGVTTPSTGKFTTLTATGATNLAAVTAGALSATSVDSTPIGQTTPAPGRFTTLVTTGAATFPAGVVLSGAASPITLNASTGTAGQVLMSAGPGATPTWGSAVVAGGSPSFASITVTGTATINTLNASAIENTPIGQVTPAVGKFTSLVATSSVSTPALTLTGPITIGGSTGTAGQVLTSAGAGVPTWTTVVAAGSSPTFPDITITGTATAGTVTATTANLTNATIGTLTLPGTTPITVGGSTGTAGQVLTSSGTGAAPTWSNLVVTNAALTSGTINNVVIGGVTPSSGTFNSLGLSGLTSPMLLTGSAGTLGQVLTSQGPGATPIWTTPSTGGGGSGTVAITGGTIDGTTIGGINPADGTFVNLAVSATSTLGPVSSTSLNTGTINASATTVTTLTVTANTPISINGSIGTSGYVLTSQGAGSAPIWSVPVSSPVAAITSGTITGVAMTSSTVNSTPIGQTVPAAGAFLMLQATSAVLGATSATSLDATPIGATTPSTAVFTSLGLNSTTSPMLLNGAAGTAGQILTSAGPGATPTWTTPSFAAAAITSGTIDGATIGATTPSTGAFTTLSSSGTTTLGALSATSLNSTPVGATTPSTGAFTTLSSSSTTTLGALSATSINATPIGATTPSTGAFTTLTANLTTVNGLVMAGTTSPITLNASPGTSGQVLTSQGAGTTPIWTTPSGGGAGSYTITGGSIDNTPIGATTPSTGVFTSLGLASTTSPMLLNGSAGTAGQVLTSAGPGATPTWGAGTVFTGGTLTTALNEAPIVTLASAATVNIGAAAANTISISGTNTITAFDTIASGAVRYVVFQGALTLTHNATSLILPGAANITTNAGDQAIFVSLDAGNWRCVTYQRASGSALVGALSFWTPSQSTVAPNASRFISAFTALGTAADIDAALIPKGLGAVVASIADSTATGGNKRGTNAIDLQTSRANASEVASGVVATVSGGRRNTASGQGATVSGGESNSAGGVDAVVSGGVGNSASGQSSTVSGGDSCSASDANAAVGGGSSNQASAAWATVPGGRGNLANGQSSIVTGAFGSARQIVAARVHSGEAFSSGNAQEMMLPLSTFTTGSSATRMRTDSNAAGAANQLVLSDSCAYLVKALVVARQNTTGDTKSWEVLAHVKRDTGAATTAMVAAATITTVANTAGAAAWGLAVGADTSNGVLYFEVTGEAGKTIRWFGSVVSAQIVG